MAVDARFDKITKIERHPNADTLDIATVSNFPCIVKRGEFNEGDWCFYIRDDAKLIGYDELKCREERDREAARTGVFVTQDCFTCTFQWQDPLLKYLGNGGRVKTIKLRGKTSMGILLKPDVVLNVFIYNGRNVVSDENIEWFNEQFKKEYGGLFLEKNFGSKHWEMPVCGCSMGDMSAIGPLVRGLWKTDEENYQNIEDELFSWNEEVLITKKLDGTSCSISASPDGDVHVMSRSMDLKLDVDNVYTKAAKDIIPLVVSLAKYYNERVVVRGEVTGNGINANKVNLDCKGDISFNMFSVVFPDSNDESKRIGLYGTEWHFLEVNKKCKELTGYEIKTVPIEGTCILTRQLLDEISDRPRSEGEGRVINTKSIVLPHFKSKSKDYLAHL